MTDQMWLDYFDQLAATNRVLGIPYDSKQWKFIDACEVIERIAKGQGTPELIDEYDAKLADAGIYREFKYNRAAWKLNLIGAERIKWKKMAEVYGRTKDLSSATVITTLCWRCTSADVPTSAAFGPAAAVNILCETLADYSLNRANKPMAKWRGNLITEAARELIKPIRRYLRSQGESFVIGEDGANKVQILVDEFTACMNSKNHAGVKEFIAKICPDYEWIDVTYADEATINKIKDDVFYGEVNLTGEYVVFLQTALGIDEYNKFIKEYNGDK